MTNKKPIIFNSSQGDEFAEGEQTMELLLHYAQGNIIEVERIIAEEPRLFTKNDLKNFALNKEVMVKAPDILEEYKKKAREFQRMQQAVQGIVSSCETIFKKYEKEYVVDDHYQEINVLRYSEEGDLILKALSGNNNSSKKISIKFPKKLKK